MTGPTLGTSTANWYMKFNEHLLTLNISGHVLVKIVEKLRAQHSRTGLGCGPTLISISCGFFMLAAKLEILGIHCGNGHLLLFYDATINMIHSFMRF